MGVFETQKNINAVFCSIGNNLLHDRHPPVYPPSLLPNV